MVVRPVAKLVRPRDDMEAAFLGRNHREGDTQSTTTTTKRWREEEGKKTIYERKIRIHLNGKINNV